MHTHARQDQAAAAAAASAKANHLVLPEAPRPELPGGVGAVQRVVDEAAGLPRLSFDFGPFGREWWVCNAKQAG